MTALVARQKETSFPTRKSSGADDGNSSESSPLASLSESTSSRDDVRGLRRGFLLSKSIRANDSTRKNKVQQLTESIAPELSTSVVAAAAAATTTTTIAGTKSEVSPSASVVSSAGPAAKLGKHNKSNIKKFKQKQSTARSPQKKDSGWVKGFLTNKKNNTITAEVREKRKSKARTPIDNPLNKKDFGWSRGFLTNTNTNNKRGEIKDESKKNLSDNNYDPKIELRRKQQYSPAEEDSKAIRSSDKLVPIVGDDNRCSRNRPQIIAPVNITTETTITAGNKKSLISIVFEENAKENVSNSDPLKHFQEESTEDTNERESKGDLEGKATKLTMESLMNPLKSIAGEDEYGEEKSSSIFMKEVTTRRKSNFERSELAGLPGVKQDEGCCQSRKGSSFCTENMKDESSYNNCTLSSTVCSTNPSNKKSEEENSGSAFTNDNDDNGSILRFQQELERLFSRPPKSQYHKECDDCQDDYDLQNILVRFTKPDHRRYAWIYLLQQKQQQDQQKARMQNGREGNECDSRIREWFFQLVDAQYFHQQHHNTIIHYYNYDIESPLESILRCVETEVERRITFEAVLMIQEYFIVRYKKQEQILHHKEIPLSSKGNRVADLQVATIQRLVPLSAQLALLSTCNRRTMLAQTAWETAILLFSFCIRVSSRMSPFPSSLSSIYNSLEIFRKLLYSLLNQQLMWQQAKKKSNGLKINQLQEVKAKLKNMIEVMNAQQESSNSLLKLHLELVPDLEKLIKI